MNVSFSITEISKINSEKFHHENYILGLELKGRVDISNSEELLFLLSAACCGGVKRIVVEMHELEYIDSSGIGVLIKITNIAREKSGDLVITSVPSSIEKIFNLVNLQKFIHMYDSSDSAISYLRTLPIEE